MKDERWFPEECKRRGGHIFSDWSKFYAPIPFRSREWVPATDVDIANVEFSAHRARICACCGKVEQQSNAKASSFGDGA